MRKYTNVFCRVLILTLVLFSGVKSYASHLVGMDLRYEYVSGYTYNIYLVAYGNCGSGGPGTAFSLLPTDAPQVYIYNGGTYVDMVTLSIVAPSEGVEITPVCPSEVDSTQCTDLTYTIPGIKKFVYTGTYTFSGPAEFWRIVFTGSLGPSSEAGRAAAITNIVSAGSTFVQLIDTLNNLYSPNTSTLLEVVPTPFFCENNSDSYNPGGVNADHDSLTYFLVTAMNGTYTSTLGGPVSYIAGCSGTNPLGVPLYTSSMAFNSATGQINFYPTSLYRSVVVYNVEEHRGDTLVGTSQREMTFLVLTCSTTPAWGALTGATNGVIINSGVDSLIAFKTCQNTGPFSFEIFPRESDSLNNITVTYTGLPSGATLTVTNNSTPKPGCVVNWTSTGIAPGTYTFYLTYTDDHCPLAGVSTIAYSIIINPQPSIGDSMSLTACDNKAKVTILPSTGGLYQTIQVINSSGVLIQTLYDTTGLASLTDSLAAGTYKLVNTSRAGCVNTVNVTVPVDITPTLTFSVITVPNCFVNGIVQINPGPLGVSGAGPWVIKVSTTPGDTIQTYTGVIDNFLDTLAPGTYTITIYNNVGCNQSVNFTLNPPPDIVPVGTKVNPSYCGASDGSITLSHLWAGTLDTIRYSFDGTPQPYVLAFIPSDSAYTITGLSAGTYTNIITTFGHCISTDAGPITLINPPFPMRIDSSVNPTWCGLCNGSITISGLHPGQLDTLNYMLGGVAQPQIIEMVPADSMITINGLCAGTYSNFIAHTDGDCISPTLGPVVLTAPPLVIRAITDVNPSWCGVCDGSITLYGLHPGDINYINYTLNGVAQAPVTVTIPADSQVVLSGLCAGTYGNFVASNAAGCTSNSVGPVTLTPPPFTAMIKASTNPSWCGICDGSITIGRLHPGDMDTIYYTYNGIPQPPVVRPILSDSIAVLNDLCGGSYTDIYVTKAGGCTSNIMGPVVLTTPPFTIRALSKVDPSYCGICNGTITIYGIHPAELDTIKYNYNGVPQTPIVMMIPPDSSVTISNLCQGNYDNFVVSTAGGCVSNILGPITLDVPPFTISYLTFSNPTRCGFCDGTIQVHGLYPGEIDSVFYTFNGVQQQGLRIIAGADSIALIPDLCAGTYDSIVAHANNGNCVSNFLGPVTLVAPPLTANFKDSIHLGCRADTVFFTNLSQPTTDMFYRWFFGDGGKDIVSDPIHIYNASGAYLITLVANNTKCYDSVKKTINLDNIIHAEFVKKPVDFVCQDSIVTFINMSTGSGLNYLWSFGDGATSTITNPMHEYLWSGKYPIYLAVSNFVPCFDTVTQYITVDTNSAISVIASDTTVCQEGPITFTGTYALEGNIGVLWTFGNGSSQPDINPALYSYGLPGSYIVTIVASYRSCPAATTTMTVNVIANPQINLGHDTTICPGGNPITLFDKVNIGVPNAVWLWNTGETTPTIAVGQPGVYFVKVTNEGCTSVDSIHVANDCYMDIPNAFSPNGDGVNDYFFPRQLLTSGLVEFSMNIYNRWGELIFASTTTDGRGWDGTFNGVAQPTGVYVYVIDAQFKDGSKEHHQGNITLLR